MSLNIADSSKASENYARTTDEVATSLTSFAPKASESVRRFQPRLLPTLAAALLLPLLIAAGNWQWNKASAKRALQQQLDSRGAESAVQISTTLADPQALRYRRIVAQGYYEPQYQVLIDNRTLHEKAGFHVVTPLRIEGSELRLLVNRGWIPANAEHREVPQVKTPTGKVEIAGTAVVPGAYFFTLGTDHSSRTTDWQSVWQNLDLHRYVNSAPFPIQPIVIELDAQSSAGGFAREWRRPDERLLSHLSYAFQWWGMAATTVVLWLVLNFRKVR
ncbi:MAG: SURF1 family protein [Propionivibrio sp.]|nr:SURF1 family protein [Propionivibrio sp.]MBK8402430.1 SURF1 family protein [Propionivibrio sp.]MBK8743584.1 SURF1 family protein [Propionivibrio sp.]MBK8892888.1 SURF1 family protein [Propionivibrio sp.]MBL0206449.1 SURF1 family protein [Propionivibrio sp.]